MTMNKNGDSQFCDRNEEVPLLKGSGQPTSKWKGFLLKYCLVALYDISFSIVTSCKSQLVYKRISSQSFNSSNNTSEEICGEVNGSIAEDVYQTRSTNLIWYLSLVENCIALPMIIILGVYSDKIGRKYCILISLVTTLIKQTCMTVNEAFDQNINYLYIGFALSGMGGGVYSFFAALTASLADSTTPYKQRSIAIAAFYFMCGVGYVISQYAVGYAIKYYGFVLPLAFASGLTILESVLVFFFFQDELKKHGSDFKNLILNLKDLIANKRKNYYPLWIYFAYACTIFLTSSPNESRDDIETLFMLRSPFCWGSEYIGRYQSVESAIHMLVGPLIIAVLHIRFNDETITCLGIISGMAFFTTFAFAVKDWMIYTGAALGVLCYCILPCIKASLSKMAPQEVQGSMFAIIYITEVAANIAGSTVFNNIYAQTQSVMPGITFLCMTGFNLISLFCIMSVIVFKKSQKGRAISSLESSGLISVTNS